MGLGCDQNQLTNVVLVSIDYIIMKPPRRFYASLFSLEIL